MLGCDCACFSYVAVFVDALTYVGVLVCLLSMFADLCVGVCFVFADVCVGVCALCLLMFVLLCLC